MFKQGVDKSSISFSTRLQSAGGETLQEEQPQFITSVNTISAIQDWFSSSWNSLPTPRKHFLKRFAHYNPPPQEPPAFIYLIAFF